MLLSRITYLVLSVVLLTSCGEPKSPRLEEDFNFGWKFSLNNDIGSASMTFDDAEWQDVRLPHDWATELPYDSVNGLGNTAYVLGGIGWYRKSFTTANPNDRIVYLHFDGIYNHSEIWINGSKVQEYAYGYSPFYVDITEYLNEAGEDNVVAVQVDRSRYADSRWYSGSGIYRNVKLVTASKVHIPIWGTFVTTPEVSKEQANVQLELNIANFGSDTTFCDVMTQIVSEDGKVVEEMTSKNVLISPEGISLEQSLVISHPELWDIDNPHLYKANTYLLCNYKAIDKFTTTFGVRSIEYDAKKGFFLNGENIKIKGVCIHADGGAVGVAVPKGVWRRRLQTLKDGGCNALRISHHPASDELLDLCDEMGFLVQDEFFDEWNYPKDKRLNTHERHSDYISRGYADDFEDNAEKDLKNAMMAHRNHPSVFQWSIGNEIEWTYPRNRKATGFFDNMDWDGNYFWSPPPYSTERIKKEYESLEPLEYNIGETAQQLAKWTRELDTTRPVTANCILPSASFQTGYADALDIVGFSYRRVMYDYARENFPNKVVMGTENLPQYHEWKAVAKRDFISGLFLWTGIDYLGEATDKWPVRGTASGLLDIAGFEKPAYHMYKTLWSEKPHTHICTQALDKTKYKINDKGDVVEKKEGAWKEALWFWPDLNEHWNYKQGEQVIVQVLSNSSAVELFLDNKSLGTRKLKDFPDHIYKWSVNYQPGRLRAKSKTSSHSISTAGVPNTMTLNTDKAILSPDGYDVAHVELQLLDVNQNEVKTLDQEVHFVVEGDAEIIGIDNGSLSNMYPYKGNKVMTHRGKALLIVQSKKDGSGVVKIIAINENTPSASATIKLKDK